MICQKFISKSLLLNEKISLRLVVALNAIRPLSQKKAFPGPGVPYPPRDPPPDYNPTKLNTEAFEAPTNVQLLVFRPLKRTDVLGPKADKANKYKNPEYYAYHRYSFYDLHKNAMRIRMENRMLEMCPYALPRKELEQCEGDDKDDDDDDETDRCECEDEKGPKGKGNKRK